MSKDEYFEGLDAKPEVCRFHLGTEAGHWRAQALEGSDSALLHELLRVSPAWLERLPLDTPVQALVGMLMVQARHSGMELFPKGLLHAPTLELRRLPPRKAEPGTRYPFDGLNGVYAAHWGITDLYPEHEKALREAFGSGQPFDTREFGAKKEIQFARICRDEAGVLHVRVRCEADDPLALADTALWSVAKETSGLADSGLAVLLARGLTEQEGQEVLQELADAADIEDPNEAAREKKLPVAASFEELVTWLDRLTDEAEAELDERTERLKEVCRQWLAAR